MIDMDYPAIQVELAIDGICRSGDRPGALEQIPTPVATVAHRVVSEALADQDYAHAERAARLARALLPDDETPVLDLARVLDARGQVQAARDVLAFFAGAARGRPTVDKKGW